MKRVLLTVAVALLIPGLLWAADPTVGVYFSGYRTYTPTALTQFKGQLFICQDLYYVTAIEYALYTPDDPGHAFLAVLGVQYPPNHILEMGDVWLGHSITYYPPLTGYPTGCDLLCTYTMLTTTDCTGWTNYPLDVGPHPDTGELRGTYAPNAEFFDITGLRSLLCNENAVEDASWGAIKSMNR
jgi:hypothetical protein